MEKKDAVEYHADLWKRLVEFKRRHWIDAVWWIPAIGASGYFALDSLAGGILGCLIGWGITAILSAIEQSRLNAWVIEHNRHLYLHTDEVEEGKKLYEEQLKQRRIIDGAVKRWWQR